MSGITPTGFARKTPAEIASETIEEIRDRVDDRLVLDETTPLGNILEITLQKLGSAWEALEQAYHAFDPASATGDAMIALAELTGTDRLQPSRGSVLGTCTLAIGSYSAGQLVAHRTGDATNRWRNVNPILVTVPGAKAVAFESETTGPSQYVAAGELNTIAETVVGWSAVTNAGNSIRGKALETIEELRLRRSQNVRGGGLSPLPAIVSAVRNIPDVLDVIGEENTAAIAVDGIAPGGIRITIYDAAGAADDGSIAQAISDRRGAGCLSSGAVAAATVTPDGRFGTERFARATADPLTIAVEIDAPNPVAIADVKAAIVTAIGAAIEDGNGRGAVRYLRVAASPYEVPGVKEVVSFTINGAAADHLPARFSIATIDPAAITVTGDVT